MTRGRTLFFLLLALTGCKALFAKTSVVVFADYPASLQVDQLRFTATVNGGTIFGPVARPFSESGTALPPPQSIRFDVNDSFAGKAASLHASGYWQGKEVTNGDASFAFVKDNFVEVHVTMTDLHTDCTKCATCCQDGFCLDATGLQACGTGGETCVICDPVRADNCSDSGVCQCGSSGLECAGGQHCVGGACTCDDISCLGGCCDGDNCKTRTLASCGAQGGTCEDCGTVAADGCSATGACQCGIDAPCGANLHCVAGSCVCDEVGCANGCCENNTCFAGNGDINRCGNGGFACSACPQTPVAQTCSAQGQCSGCNATTCSDGCCSGTCTHQFSLSACGIAGGLCSACDETKADTCDKTSGDCKCGANAACGDGQRCSGGQCICDGLSCAGCCSGAQCLSGQTDAGACGVGGNACSSCGTGACNGGVCANCNSGNCNGGCCTGSVCNAPAHASGCQINGGACIACDSKSDSCANGQCVCGTTGAACAPGQECVSGQCVCDSNSCSAIGKCCNGNACVAAGPTNCGSGTGTVAATCVSCVSPGGATDSCDPTTYTCECGAGVACPNAAGTANVCASGACVCGSTGAACGTGMKCSGSGASATCVCDATACGAASGCCNTGGTACVFPGSQSATQCGNIGAACQDCTSGSHGNTCNAGVCQCGTGSVCASGQALVCTGSGNAAFCACDTTKCTALNGCCSDTPLTAGTTCVTTQATAACGKTGLKCDNCTFSSGSHGKDSNVCDTTTGACTCGTSAGGGTDAICGAGLDCNNSGGTAATCVCGATTGCAGCCSSATACVANGATNSAACGTNAAICKGCASNGQECLAGTCTCDGTSCPGGCCDGGALGTCLATSGQSPSKCGDGTAGDTCGGCSGPATPICSGNNCVACSASTCPNGCCDSLSGLCLTSGNASCGTAGASCVDCQDNGQECVSNLCQCDSTSCTLGCCDGAGVCQTSEVDTLCGLAGATCTDCTLTSQTCGAGACGP